MSQDFDSSGSLPYATPALRGTGKTTAAVWIVVAGLALIGLGGCFCIGIMLTVEHGFNNSAPPGPLTGGDWGLICVLGVLAAAAFGGAVVLLWLGVTALLRLTRS